MIRPPAADSLRTGAPEPGAQVPRPPFVRQPSVEPPRAASAVEVVTQLSRLDGWQLRGDGAALHIGKVFAFADFYQTMAFVNGVALLAHRLNHHPTLEVSATACAVRLRSHDAGGLSALDFDLAARIDALLA